MKAKIIDGRRYLYRGRHRKRSAVEEDVAQLRRRGRLVKTYKKGGMIEVWATSMFD